MNHRLIGTLLVFLALVTKLSCDAVRLSMLKRFALSSGMNVGPQSLWWNGTAERKIRHSLPKGPLRSQIRTLETAGWVAAAGILLSAIVQTLTG